MLFLAGPTSGCQDSPGAQPADLAADLAPADLAVDAPVADRAVPDQGKDQAAPDLAVDSAVPQKCNANNPGRTVGLRLCTPEASPGYTLLTPTQYTRTYLLDMEGRVVHTWDSKFPAGEMAYLLPNGNLLRAANDPSVYVSSVGGHGGRVQIMDWNGKLVWDWSYCKVGSHCQHHDTKPLPNGNVLVVAWEFKTKAEAIAAGVKPSLLGSFTEVMVDHLLEVKPTGLSTGDVVWRWNFWDHLVQDQDTTKANYGKVDQHPELMDINFVAQYLSENDISHINSVDYDPKLDQLVLSVLMSSEVMVIDHSTTTAEAAGHSGGKYGRGGDYLYRWGNPEAYDAGNQGTLRTLYGQHDASWVPAGFPGAGNILTFNNGTASASPYSTVEEIKPPRDSTGKYTGTVGKPFAPVSSTWTFKPGSSLNISTVFGGSAQRLSNGNTLLCESDSGILFEVTPAGKVVWQYGSPVNRNGPVKQGTVFGVSTPGGSPIVMNVRRYEASYPGLAGKKLTPMGYVELPGAGPDAGAPDAGAPDK